jgi:hydroxymethylpyrimidine kinase/phosphomethylpyrimidine kinase
MRTADLQNADLQKPARRQGALSAERGIENAELKESREFSDAKKSARDYLFLGGELTIFDAEFIETKSTHGTGCSLASAIAAGLARGFDLSTAVQRAKEFVTQAIRTSANIGHGNPSVNHSVPGFDR